MTHFPTFARLLALATFGTSLIAATPPSSHARPVPDVTRTLLRTTDVPSTDLETRLYRITYPPAVAAPTHTHPVVGLGYVIAGSAVSQFAGEPPQTLSGGPVVRGSRGHAAHRVPQRQRPPPPRLPDGLYRAQKGAPVTVFAN